MVPQDPYRILGLERDASAQQIKQAFRSHSLRCHPDRDGAPGATERFNAVVEAYNRLSNVDARRSYDLHHPLHGADRRLTLWIEIWEKYAGVEKVIPLATFGACEACAGLGRVGRTCVCPSCSGTSLLYTPIERPRDGVCRVCDGFGILGKTCHACNGVGRRRTHYRLKFTLPRNVDDNTVIRLRGAGDVGIRGGPRGDVYIRIRVRPVSKAN